MLWLQQNYMVIFMALYVLDRMIEASPLKSNSVFQAINAGLIKMLVSLKVIPSAPDDK